MATPAEDAQNWLDKQIRAAEELITGGGQALRRGQTNAGSQALREAEAILEMAEIETDALLEMRARVFNELGVVHQRGNDLETARDYHSQAAQLSTQLLEKGRDIAANSAATHLNLSSIHLALGEVEKALEFGEKALQLLEESRENTPEDQRRPSALQLGALQNLAVIQARRESWEKAGEAMEKARVLVEELVEAGRPDFLAQLAQGCQQLSVVLFDGEQFDDALHWGEVAEGLSERAYEKLGQPVLPVYIISQINLISYNEKLGRFADGEDCLWKALDVAGEDPRILERGVVFYETCRKQADPRLEEGNLPREEVEEGYEEILERVEAVGGLKAVREQAQQIRQSQRGRPR